MSFPCVITQTEQAAGDIFVDISNTFLSSLEKSVKAEHVLLYQPFDRNKYSEPHASSWIFPRVTHTPNSIAFFVTQDFDATSDPEQIPCARMVDILMRSLMYRSPSIVLQLARLSRLPPSEAVTLNAKVCSCGHADSFANDMVSQTNQWSVENIDTLVAITYRWARVHMEEWGGGDSSPQWHPHDSNSAWWLDVTMEFILSGRWLYFHRVLSIGSNKSKVTTSVWECCKFLHVPNTRGDHLMERVTLQNSNIANSVLRSFCTVAIGWTCVYGINAPCLCPLFLSMNT